MSFVDFEKLKSPRDTTIPFTNRTVSFSTSQVLVDSLVTFGALIKSFRIVNRDPGAALTYRNKSPSATLETVPPNSDASDDDWSSYFEINPNAVSGNGIVEFELVTPGNAYQK